MKKLFAIVFLITSLTISAQVGINTTTPDASSMLDVTSTDKGMLVPRMTQAQRTAIVTPATSLLIYQTDAATGFWYYNGTAWVNLNNSSGEFKSIGGLVQNTTNTAGDDFVFGSTSLADIAGTNDDNRMFFNKSKGAFRAGQVTGTQWNDANAGIFSAALGANTTASGATSVATGFLTNSSGTASTATGQQTVASANWSTSMGVMTNASGEASLATGFLTTASGDHSISLGDNNTAPSYGEAVLGTFGTTYTPVSATAFDANDRVFSVGNGIPTARSNAMTILKNGNIGVGTDTPTASALLDLTSTNKGMLIPRMTQAQRTAISTPATSLLVYQTDATTGFWYYNGTAWANLNSSSGEFKSIAGLVQNTTNTAADDFVFGSTSLADIPGPNDNKHLFFDKSKGAFRAGEANGTSWDDLNVGASSIGLGPDTTASGWASTAMGFQTTASANASTAMGQNTIASGSSSMATGWTTTASGLNSTAMGDRTTASGSASTAIGVQTTALGIVSTAMGYQTTASGIVSTAMGYITTASGDRSAVMGMNNVAPSFSETVLGAYATTYTPASATAFNPADRIFSVGNGTTAARNNAMTLFKNGNFIVGSDNSNDITGTTDDNRLFFNKSKGAFRAGQVTGTQWDTANVGTNSTALGINTTASGSYSTAMGYVTIASGGNSTAMGGTTVASGGNSTAMGSNTTASGGNSTAMGRSTSAQADDSTAMGYQTTASGSISIAMGAGTVASGWASAAIGKESTASGSTSIAMGNRSGAYGDISTAMGDTNYAPSYSETVLGTYATTYTPVSATAFNAADCIFSVGNGTSTTRSNAMTILKNGRIGLGTDNPTKGLLEINGVGLGQGTLTVISHGNGAGTTALATLTGGTYGASTYSIWVSGNIAATQFHAYSDARIKKVIGVTNNANDLQTLEKIEITNYKMADSLQLGNKPIKKVIAQQIEKVYPQAVTNNLTEVIPNIYKVSQIKNGWIDLIADVKVADKVKLLFDGSEKLVTVTEVSAKGFKVNTDTEGAVFIYGKQVNDFRAVDYEALSMLNISATQELLKRIKELEADKTNLTTKVKTLEQNQASINTRLEQLEGFLLKNATSTTELTTSK